MRDSTNTTGQGEQPISNRWARREQFKRTIAILAELFPTTFVADKSKPHRPLKIGIGRDLIDRRVLAPKECQALSSYVARRMYQAALAAGGPRFDLDGNPVGEVTPDQVEHALATVGHIDAKAIARAKATRLQTEPRAVGQQPTSGTPPAPPPQPSSDSTPRGDGIAALKRAAVERRAVAP